MPTFAAIASAASVPSKEAGMVQQESVKLRTHEFKAKVRPSFCTKSVDRSSLLAANWRESRKANRSCRRKQTYGSNGFAFARKPTRLRQDDLDGVCRQSIGIGFCKSKRTGDCHHAVKSLDPAEAPNASAREEVNRINLALEMGDIVMLYLDDIQHCDPEHFRKFIPLCDATRKIEGVWNGQPKSYDLRGRKVAVVMAGNPYTESGQRFQIPDMLANRADVYNLGEIIGDSREALNSRTWKTA